MEYLRDKFEFETWIIFTQIFTLYMEYVLDHGAFNFRLPHHQPHKINRHILTGLCKWFDSTVWLNAIFSHAMARARKSLNFKSTPLYNMTRYMPDNNRVSFPTHALSSRQHHCRLHVQMAGRTNGAPRRGGQRSVHVRLGRSLLEERAEH